MNINNQLIQALDYSASIIVMTDMAGTIQYVNKTFEKKYGYTKEEALGLNPRILKTNDNSDDFYKELWETILSGKTWQGMFLNKAKDGKLIWENAIINPVFSGDGEISGFIAIKEDITELKKTILKLEISNKRYLSLVEDAPAMICRFNKNGNLTYANQKYIETLFPDKNDIKGISYFHYMHKKDKDIIQKHIKELTAETPILEYENKIILNNKDIKWYRNICRALFDENDELLEYQVVSMDFTDQKEAEEAMIAYQKKLNAIINNSLVGIVVFNVDDTLILANDYFLDLMGSVSLNDLCSLDADSASKDDKKMIRALKKGKIDNYHISKHFISKKGIVYYVNIFLSPILNESNKVVEIAAIIVDNTEQKKMELQMIKDRKKLEELNKTKDKLFSIIAHDIKNPFNVILGFANLLSNNFDNYRRNEIKDFINRILTASENVYKLLDDLLIWSKSQMGQLKAQPDKINLNEIIISIHDHFNVIAGQKDIQMINLIPDNVYLYVDYEMIRFICRNMIHNAIKFTPGNGQIICRGKQKNGMYEIEIEDTGIGINKDKLATLFDMSNIMETNGTDEEKGTGLGLFLSKEMIIKNNGTIDVRSEVSKGTTFIITLPLYKE